ncbi:MAG: hypothetical protein ACTSPW_10045 [Promethearchaeota archaeon]
MHKNFWNLIELKGDSQQFKYLHGVEMEYFLLDKNFKPVKDNSKFINLILKAMKKIQNKIDSNKIYKKKITELDIGTEEILKERGNEKDRNKIQTVYIKYEQNNKEFGPIDIIGRDTNIGTGGFITLELVTPPCANVKELSWWIQTIIFSTLEACNEMDLNFLMCSGHNNIRNNYCGEHHHIGISNLYERKKVYNVLRLFLPYLSVLSFSYFNPDDMSKNLPISIKSNIFETKVSNQFIRGCRLKNTNQIKPVPPLKSSRKEDFAKDVGLEIHSCRMVDLFPFTDYNTLEIRIFDTQISISRTIAFAILLQAISILALDIDDNFLKILNEIYQKNYYQNLRAELIKKGLNFFHTDLLFSSIRKSLKKICRFCENRNKCKNKLPNSNCNFKIENTIMHNITSTLFFPRKFIINNNYYYKSKNKITAKDTISQIFLLLHPYLKKMRLTHSIPLKVLKKTIKSGIEPSMYWLIMCLKYNKNLELYFKKQIENINKMKNSNTKWGIYYDPYLEAIIPNNN